LREEQSSVPLRSSVVRACVFSTSDVPSQCVQVEAQGRRGRSGETIRSTTAMIWRCSWPPDASHPSAALLLRPTHFTSTTSCRGPVGSGRRSSALQKRERVRHDRHYRLKGFRLKSMYHHQVPLIFVLCLSDCCQVLMLYCFILHRARPTIDRMCATTVRAKCKTPCYGSWASARETHAKLCLSPYSGCPISASQSAVF